MKGVMKGKMMKKLKSIKPGDYLKPDRILQVSNFDEFVDNFSIKSNLKFSVFKDRDPNRRASCKVAVPPDPFQHVDMDELARQLEAEENEEEKLGFHSRDSSKEDAEDKENIRPSINKIPTQVDLSDPSDFDISSFRRPDLDSVTLFDPNLLSAFHQAVIEYLKKEEEEQLKAQQSGKSVKPETDELTEDEETFPLLNFQEKCPPGGSYSVILYTTSLRGIRKTFEDCHSVRFLLESFRVIFQERDISIHSEFREEMWSTLGGKSLPPRLFIMGRYIGGAEEVLSLHEHGKLKGLFEGVPRNQRDSPCQGCGGFRFVVCFRCDGSTRVVDEDDDEGDNGGFLSRIRCPECNENGLIVCPYCC